MNPLIDLAGIAAIIAAMCVWSYRKGAAQPPVGTKTESIALPLTDLNTAVQYVADDIVRHIRNNVAKPHADMRFEVECRLHNLLKDLKVKENELA